MEIDELNERTLQALEKIAGSLDRIALAQEHSFLNEQRGMELAETFTGVIKSVLENEGLPMKVDVEVDLVDVMTDDPPTIGDVVSIGGDVEMRPDDGLVFGKDDPYDPADDTTCPNCIEGEGAPVVDHGGPTGALMCDQCHHVWIASERDDHARESSR